MKKQAKRPEGHEYYENDPISHIPKIGKTRRTALNRCGISTINNYINHPETMEHLTSEKEFIERTIKDGLGTKIINPGNCPEEIDNIDHRKSNNPYESKYGENCEEKSTKPQQ